MEGYSSDLIDFFLDVSHAGKLSGPNVVSASHVSKQPFSDLTVYFLIEGEIIKQAAFNAGTTAALIAVAEWVCHRVEGMNIADVKEINALIIQKELGLSAKLLPYVNIILQLLKKLGA